jgi:hypothetical protein
MASRLTTTDNPFNPFTEWVQWFAWDHAAGYDTPSYLARIVVMSDELPEADEDAAIEDAIDEILEEHPTGPYVRASDPRTEGTATKV